MAAGDFDNDGYDDLAIGVPDEDIGSIKDAGSVNVLYGTSSGLSSSGDQSWHQNTSGIVEASEADDRFGSALATGDFDNDGRDDLAIGVPGEDSDNGLNPFDDVNAGAVNVIYGASNGLTSSGDQFWTQDSPGIIGATESEDRFGEALAAGDFDGDGRDDLAIGIPGENATNAFLEGESGAVAVLYGSNNGVSSTDQFWHQDSTGIAGVTEGGDKFGAALSAGDFNGDGRDDLAIGVPGEDEGAIIDAGIVQVIYGTANRLNAANDQVWHQNSTGIAGVVEFGDGFGSSLASGDLNNDGRDDLAIGVPFEDIGIILDAGMVNVIFGSANRLTSTGDRGIHQDSVGLSNADVETVAELGDNFGAALVIGDFDGNNRDDLAIGVPGEAIGWTMGAGMLNIFNQF